MIKLDPDLEAAIDTAGREAVFDKALSLGWSVDNPPPKWVWREIARQVRSTETNALSGRSFP